MPRIAVDAPAGLRCSRHMSIANHQESSLPLVVPEAERAVREHRAEFDLAARVGVPAHITVAYPFKPVGGPAAPRHRRLLSARGDPPGLVAGHVVAAGSDPQPHCTDPVMNRRSPAVGRLPPEPVWRSCGTSSATVSRYPHPGASRGLPTAAVAIALRGAHPAGHTGTGRQDDAARMVLTRPGSDR